MHHEPTLSGGEGALTIVYYDDKYLEEKEEATLEDAMTYLNRSGITWMIFHGSIKEATLEQLEKLFSLHPVLMEDIAGVEERAKVENFIDNIFFVMRELNYSDEEEKIIDQQVSMILGDRYVISFISEGSEVLRPVFERLYRGNHRIRRLGTDYLAYAILDSVLDGYYIALEKLDEKLSRIEEDAATFADKKTLDQIQIEKKETSKLRRSVWPMRELISHIRRMESTLITEDISLFLLDANDHANQAIDRIEGFRDVVGGMYDVYQSTTNRKLNEIIKFLTIVATIFAPLTFLTGVYGMNFEYMPGLHSVYALPVFITLMVTTTAGMLSFFRYKRWI